MNPDGLAVRIADAVCALPTSGDRRLIAIAGPPGAGKTTVASHTRDELIARGLKVGLLGMDGFHLDNRVLVERGLLARKGAPETFDVDGFRTTLQRLITETEVAVPEFDRVLDVAIAARSIITADQRVVLVEGNYLLLNDPPWSELRRFWALSVFLRVPLPELETRLVQRWLDHGLDDASATKRAQENDIPNAMRVNKASSGESLTLG